MLSDFRLYMLDAMCDCPTYVVGGRAFVDVHTDDLRELIRVYRLHTGLVDAVKESHARDLPTLPPSAADEAARAFEQNVRESGELAARLDNLSAAVGGKLK